MTNRWLACAVAVTALFVAGCGSSSPTSSSASSAAAAASSTTTGTLSTPATTSRTSSTASSSSTSTTASAPAKHHAAKKKHRSSSKTATTHPTTSTAATTTASSTTTAAQTTTAPVPTVLTTSQFKTAFTAYKTQFKTLATALGVAIGRATKATGPSIAALFKPLKTRAQIVATQLATLKTPAKYKASIDQVVSGIGAMAIELGQLIKAEDAHNAALITADAEKLIEEAQGIKSTDDTVSTSLGLPTT